MTNIPVNASLNREEQERIHGSGDSKKDRKDTTATHAGARPTGEATKF
jgi:hypothetical protein